MKNIAPSLAALALAGIAATPSFGASVADDLQIKVKGVIQARATVGANATDATGGDQDFYNTNNAAGTAASTQSEDVRFGIRRARLAFDATNSTGWFANTTIRAETIELSGSNNNAQSVNIYYAYIGKRFKGEVIEQELKLGLDKPFNNEGSISSSNQLFGVARPLATMIDFQREPGASYRVAAPFLRAGVDVQNSTNLTRASTAAGANRGNLDRKPSPFTSFRIEVAPGADFMPAKKTESWAGVEGKAALLGFEWQDSGNTYAVNNQERSLQVFGPDLLAHYNGLSFLAEYRWSKISSESTLGALPAGQTDAIKGKSWDAQLGYAIPLENGLVVEPALGYSIVNMNKDVDESSTWGLNASRDNNVANPAGFLTGGLVGTNFGSGSQVNAGINLYWNGHANKTQIGYMNWKAEDGDAKAHAFYVQQQVTF